jgi:hypothetical protein
MMSHHVYYQLARLGLLGLYVILPSLWPSRGALAPQAPAEPVSPTFKRKRATEPTPCAGLTHNPPCALCEHEATHPPPPPPGRPDPMPPPHRRPWASDTARPFCPHGGCAYRGWLGLGNLHAMGQPSGGPWRQVYWRSCHGSFLETHGTLFHGKRLSSVELIGRVLACLAEGLGIRATARVFEVAPNTVLGWRVEAAAHLQTFSCYFLCDVHGRQGQLDESYAVLRAVQAGHLSEAEAIQRLARSPSWVWTAMDPENKLLLVMDMGPRPLAMAQRVGHQVGQVWALDGVSLFLTDGFREYRAA